jgi:hypothetical protein
MWDGMVLEYGWLTRTTDESWQLQHLTGGRDIERTLMQRQLPLINMDPPIRSALRSVGENLLGLEQSKKSEAPGAG